MKSDYDMNQWDALEPLIKVTHTYATLFKNETCHNFQIDAEVILTRVDYFAKQGVLELSEDRKSVRLLKREDTAMLLDFFSHTILPLIDTYLITLTAIEQLCGKNLVIKKKTLAKELHVGIKYLYS